MAYHSGPFSKKYSRSSVYSNIAVAILPSLVYHFISIAIINNVNWIPNVSFKAIGILLLGKDTDQIVETFDANVGQCFYLIAIYLALSVIISGIIGLRLAKVVRNNNWDCKYSWLRFDNKWYYVMNGEILVWREENTDEKKRLENLARIKKDNYEVAMECLVEVVGAAYIYEGTVARFFLNKDGLDRIHLNNCTRTPFPETGKEYQSNRDEKNKSTAVFLNDDVVLFRDTIININIDYNKEQGIYEKGEEKDARNHVNIPEDKAVVIVGKKGKERLVNSPTEEKTASKKKSR